MRKGGASRIIGALIFAFAIITSALVFKGTSTGYWVETALTGIALVFVALKRPACSR